MRKICFITGTRAEYGLLSGLMRLVQKSPLTQLQVIATNMHLMPEFGNTYLEIEADGFSIDEKVFMPKPSDDSSGIVLSMAEEMKGMNEALERLAPDLVVILGDRYEMLIAAIVAMIHRIPIAHLHGGEISEGAIDDSIRHAITKLSNLHFTATEDYRRRVIQLGEDPSRVFYVGAIGVENLKSVPLMQKKDLEDSLGFLIDDNTVLATYHPTTLGTRTPAEDINDFFDALREFPELRIILTLPNSDKGGDDIRNACKKFAAENPNRCKAFPSLGMRRYLSALNYVAAVIGNSSSGIIEVPSAHIPTLNIGDRQKGRTHGNSVLDVDSDKKAIISGIKTILSPEFRNLALTSQNPYEKPDTALNIFNIISQYPLKSLSQKHFHNLPLL